MALYPNLANQFYADLWGTKIQHQPTQNTVLGSYSILSKDNVEWATIIAYSTIQQAIQNKVVYPMLFAYLLQNNFFSDLANDYIAYFNNPAPINQAAFDNWHRKECKKIINILEHCNAQKIATYGIAQKIVNMTFKHLSCFSDAQMNRDHFKFCHMPIDGKILSWIKAQKISVTSSIPRWSKLDDATYTKLQDDIRTYLSNKTTALEAEFVIWAKAKNNQP